MLQLRLSCFLYKLTPNLSGFPWSLIASHFCSLSPAFLRAHTRAVLQTPETGEFGGRGRGRGRYWRGDSTISAAQGSLLSQFTVENLCFKLEIMRFKDHFTESREVFCLSQAQEVPYLRQRLELQRTPSTSKSSELSITLKVTTMLSPPTPGGGM